MSSTAKLSARDRIALLLDENSFVEIGALVTKRSTDFNLQTKDAPSDGVITGYGVINDNPVYVYSQDASVLNGTMGEMHAKKISNIYDLATKVGAPVIGLIDCAGMRLEEATDALEGFASILYKQSICSGIIPQIAAVFGSCGGGLSVSASLCDFVFAEKNNGKVFVNAPNVVAGNNVSKCDTASADFKAEAGVVDFVLEGEENLLNKVRELISILPSSNDDDCSLADCTDDLNRACDTDTDDAAIALASISDNGFFTEVKSAFAKEMVTGFIKLDGMTIGAVANRAAIIGEDGKAAEKFASELTVAGCEKASKFVKFCDAFGIPVLSMINTEGYANCMCNEKKLAPALASLSYAFANATVPKISVIKKGIGTSYICMNSKGLGADLVFAVEGAQIGAMDADLAAQIIYANELDAAADKTAFKAEKAAEYAALQNNATSAAKRGYVDAVISADSVRKNLIYSFEMLYLKRENHPAKKHGTV